MHIILDLDNTLTNTPKAVLEIYREQTKDKSTEITSETLTWGLEKVCPKWKKEEVDAIFTNPKLFDKLELFDGAIEVLNKLKADGNTIEICSKHNKDGIELKKNWIKKNLPMVDKVTILEFKKDDKTQENKFDKSSIKGDLIVDDLVEALESSPCKFKICYQTYNWNKEWNGMRVANWHDLYAGIDSINRAYFK